MLLLEHGADVDRRIDRGQTRSVVWHSRVTRKSWTCCSNTERIMMPTTATA
jgi:hypothetical protein